MKTIFLCVVLFGIYCCLRIFKGPETQWWVKPVKIFLILMMTFGLSMCTLIGAHVRMFI